MTSIHIRHNTDLPTVARWWAAPGDALQIHIPKSASFSLLAEGVALGSLHALKRRVSRIDVTCAYPLPPCAKLDDVQLGFFGSLFGISLAFAADSMRDSDGRDVRSLIRESIWSLVHEGRGGVGDGKRWSLLFRNHDYTVPELLRGVGGEFGTRTTFSATLSRINALLGARVLDASSAEGKCLQEFLYQISLNAYQHGSRDDNDKPLRGVYGISIEKLIFETRDDTPDSRENLPHLIKRYLMTNWNVIGNVRSGNGGLPRAGDLGKPVKIAGRSVLALTVADFGQGIHATLPSEIPGDDWTRLHAAFETRVSRFPPSDDRERGLGLLEVIKHAKSARTFLFIRSGPYLGFRDFSQPDETLDLHDNASSPPEVYLHLRRWPGLEQPLPLVTGTSVTLLWPGTNLAQTHFGF